MIELYKQDAYDWIKSIDDDSIDLIIIDPPYINTTTPITQWKHINEQITEGFADGFDFAIFNEFKRVQKNFNIYIFCNKVLLFKLIEFFADSKYLTELLVWHKNNPPPMCNNKYLSDLEYVLYVRQRGTKLYNTYETSSKVFNSNASNAKQLKSKIYHPTLKPVDFINRFVINSSKPGDTILDCFMGSAPVAESCIINNRNFVGCEKLDKYFQVATTRIELLTSKYMFDAKIAGGTLDSVINNNKLLNDTKK